MLSTSTHTSTHPVFPMTRDIPFLCPETAHHRGYNQYETLALAGVSPFVGGVPRVCRSFARRFRTGQINPSSRPRAIAAVRLVTPSFRYTLATWVLAVLRDTKRTAPMSRNESSLSSMVRI